MKRILLLFAFFSALIGYSQSVSSVNLFATENSFTDSGNPTAINYTALSSNVYVTGTLAYYRIFLKFDLSSIPANSVIVSATMRFTPSGTENIVVTNSTELNLDACNTTWSQTTLNHSSGIANNGILTTVGVSSLVSGKREFNVKDHVQAMVDGRVPNFGWRMKRSSESSATLTTVYYSKNVHSSASRPQLEIYYYTPAYVSAATIVHASNGLSNGSISPTILLGSSATRTYQWYNASGIISGATSINLTAKPYGWYGLKSSGTTAGDDLFQAFLIGSKCEMVDISFNSGPDYIDDASITNGTIGSGLTVTNYSQGNSWNSNVNSAEQVSFGSNWFSVSSLIRFRLWIDPALEINEAKMTLYGLGHNPLERPNTSKLTQVTSNWKETGVSYGIRPALGTLSLNLPNMPAGNGNTTLELNDFFNSWKTNNLANYGIDLSLLSYLNPIVVGSTSTKQSYESSDNTNKPIVAFKVSWVNNTCDFTSYSRFKDALDGSFVRTIQGKLKVQFNEDYDQKAGRFAKLILYDATTYQIKAGINNDGTIIGAALLPAKVLEFDYNQHLLDLSTYSLVIGNDYVLELTTSKGEKSYIKFKYYN